MNQHVLNDTFDNFPFSQFNCDRTQLIKTEEPNNSSTPKTTNTDKETFQEEFRISLTNISIDDSFFLNLESPTIEKLNNNSPSNKTKNTKTTTQPENESICYKTEHLLTDSYKLSSLGLPEAILKKYESREILTMFPWQVDCLSNEKVVKNRSNLVYSAPTSAGKTLVAEIIAIKTIFECRKKVLFVLPFVSVVREKMFYFQDILSSSGVRVEGFMGSYNPPGGFQSVQLAICTIEKANSLVNKLLQENKLNEIGAVIIDEMHLLGDPSRGYLLELLLTKLRYISQREVDVNIQIIGMSATLPNLSTLAKWLDAELYTTTFRPIPLYEQAKVLNEIYNNKLELTRTLTPLAELGLDTDNILQLCLETINDSCSVLIFCPTKNWCESLAQQISAAFWKLGVSGTDLANSLRQQLKSELISELLQQLKYCPVGLDAVLRKTVSFGVAFHHAGLTMDERDIIEAAFRNGTIRVLVATSTLSSGVNLPARRVIIRTPIFHGKPLDILTYRQMIGRAGRMGKDTAGESVLICQKNDFRMAKELITGELRPIESCLEGAGKLKRAILEIIASGVASLPQDVKLFTNCTLLAHIDDEELANPIEDSLKFLIDNQFIRLQDNQYKASALGKACLSSSLPPEDGLALFTELDKARQCFVLETELHLIYLVTPYSACQQWNNLDWMFYLNLWEKLPQTMKKVGELVGIRESYIVNATRGNVKTNTSKTHHTFLIHKRFFVALALQDLVNEKSLTEVCDKFNCNRGMLQSLQLSASTFAGMVTAFSRQLGWTNVELLISQFQDRLQFGISRDLLDLMRLTIMNGKCARALHNAGIETLVQLANSNVATIENVLHAVQPFESEKVREGETEFELKERNKFRNIWITGREGLTENEAATMLLNDARNYLKIEMGLAEAQWECNQKSSEGLVEPRNNAIKSYISSEFSDLHLSSSESLFSSSVSKNTSQSLFDEKNLSNTSQDLFMSNSYESPNKGLDKSDDEFVIGNSQNDNCVLLNATGKRVLLTNDKSINESPRKKLKSISTIKETITFKEVIDLKQIEIIDVSKSKDTFNEFILDLKNKHIISLSLACSKAEIKQQTIGLNLTNNKELTKSFKKRKIDGLAITWGDNVVYYIPSNRFNDNNLFSSIINNNRLVIQIFDAKEQIKTLKNCFNIDLSTKQIEDAKIADWILNSEEKEKSLQTMILTYCPETCSLIHHCKNSKKYGSLGLDIYSSTDSKLRSSIESVVNWYLTASVKEALSLENPKLLDVFEIEMGCVSCLSAMEINGIGVDKVVLQNLVDLLNTQTKAIEMKAYSLAGKRFSFTSSKDVAKVLGIFKGKQRVSTKKQILEKNQHPISDLVLQWRKLNCTIIKMLQPLIRVIENNRIYGCSILHNSTGRISMQEPNLQNIPKQFTVINPLLMSHEKIVVNCRKAFVAKNDFILLSADYCQLELRLLAHFSQDNVLCKIMKQKGDVFKSIAAKWNNIREVEVTDDIRQHAKQLCYGIIYGMGSKTLSEHLTVSDDEAKEFMETFHRTYPNLKKFINHSIEQCKKDGFVQTLAGRRRYLSKINDKNPLIKSQAERQAVNTIIQGSAADLAKKSMVLLERRFEKFKIKPKLVLHLHDELLYEVPKIYFQQTIEIMRETMEKSVELTIPFPVKLKFGLSWGEMREL